MMTLSFVSQIPQEPYVMAIALQEEQNSPNVPSLVVEALKMKTLHASVEVFLEGKLQPQRVVAVRLPHDKQNKRQAYEETGATLFKCAAEGLDKTVLLDLRDLAEEGLDLVTGMALSSWRFHRYRTCLKSEEVSSIEKITVLCHNPKVLEEKFRQTKASLEGVFYARALTSEPPNVLYPMAYANRLQELAVLGIKVEILNSEELEKIGMTALLAAGQGSQHPSAVAMMHWKGLENSSPIALVGKGVCFDSGGLCLKPALQQLEMKWDKAGAGVVAGVMKSLALIQAPVNVVGIVGLVENMPDGTATKPGDVITTMSGQTVEIANTDCEGRLVLADCLWYVQQRYNLRAIVDLGTLTLETFASLGRSYAGLYANNFDLANELLQAGKRTGDLLWELPMGEYFAKQIESTVADMKNIGVDLMGENGAAAEFLKRFIRDLPWAHIDLAGASWTMEDTPLAPKGVTGFGVRLLVDWLLTHRDYLEPQSPQRGHRYG